MSLYKFSKVCNHFATSCIFLLFSNVQKAVEELINDIFKLHLLDMQEGKPLHMEGFPSL